ncbi:MAG: COG1361 family protein [Vulcanimicrobiaceae bacterium]
MSLRNGGSAAKRNLRVRFATDDASARFEPPEHLVTQLDAQADVTLATTVLLPDVSVSRSIKVRAELHGATAQPLMTAWAEADIDAHPRITSERTPDALILRNEGHARTTIAVLFDPQPLALDGSPIFPDLITRGHIPVPLGPNEDTTLGLPRYNGTITIRTADGERMVLRDAPPPALPAELASTFVLGETIAGARYGDLIAFQLEAENLSATPAYNVMLDLVLPSGLELVESLLSLNDVRLLERDITVSEETVSIALGRLASSCRLRLQGALRVTARRTHDYDVLDFDATVRARGVVPKTHPCSALISRSPVFGDTTTHINDIVEGPRGLQTTIEITNIEPEPFINASVNLRAFCCRVTAAHEMIDDQRVDLHIQPAYWAGPITRVNLNGLDAQTKRTIVLDIELLPEASGIDSIAIDAQLNVDGHEVSLGQARTSVSGHVDLSQSRLRYKQESHRSLRFAEPVILSLDVRNTGTIPARGVRVSINLPPEVSLHLGKPKEARWHVLIPSGPDTEGIAPNAADEWAITLYLTAPFADESFTIQPMLDADGYPPIPLPPITVLTPSTAELEISPISLEVENNNCLRVRVSVNNHGDGPTQSLSLSVPSSDNPMPRSLMIDDQPFPETTMVSPLIEGIPIDPLKPGDYRTISWLVVPGTEPYCAHVTIRNGIERERTIVSHMTRKHLRAGFVAPLADARSVGRTQVSQGFPFQVTRPFHTANPSWHVASSNQKSLNGTRQEPIAPGNELSALATDAGVEQSPIAPTATVVASIQNVETAVAEPENVQAITNVDNQTNDVQADNAEIVTESPAPEPSPEPENTPLPALVSDIHDPRLSPLAQSYFATRLAILANGIDPVVANDIAATRTPQSASEKSAELHQEEATSVEPDLSTKESLVLPQITLPPFLATEPPEEATTDFDALFDESQRDEFSTLIDHIHNDGFGVPNLDLVEQFLPALISTKIYGWRHVLAVRALLPNQHPASFAAVDGLKDIVSIVIAVGSELTVNETLIQQIETMDTIICEDTQLHYEIEASALGELDCELIAELPLDIGRNAIEESYGRYRALLNAYFTRGSDIATYDNSTRRATYSTFLHSDLDAALVELARALSISA